MASKTKSPDLAALIQAAVQEAVSAASGEAKPKGKASKASTKAKTVSNPDAQATPAQLAGCVRRLAFAVDGTEFGNRVTMGDVQAIYDAHEAPSS